MYKKLINNNSSDEEVVIKTGEMDRVEPKTVVNKKRSDKLNIMLKNAYANVMVYNSKSNPESPNPLCEADQQAVNAFISSPLREFLTPVLSR